MTAKQPRKIHLPWATLILAAINFAVFGLISLMPAEQGADVTFNWGLVPSRFLSDISSGQFSVVATAWVTPLTSLFLHELDWQHVFFNMLAFLLFGGAVERELGRWKFVGLYLTTGLLANAFWVVMVSDGIGQSIGASAAVCGVMGAWLLLFFCARWIVALVPFALLCLTVRGVLDTESAKVVGFTHCMHLAGFAIGAIVAGILTVEISGARRKVVRAKA